VYDAVAKIADLPIVECFMAMDFETVRQLRVLFAIVGAFVGGAAGAGYFGSTGGLIGLAVGALVGWNAVDLIKGRTQK